MSVVVKGMEMPVSCIACRFVEGVWCCAKPTEMSREELLGDNRPEWCPLVELPHGHGRLIDAGEFDADYEALYKLNDITNSEWILFREWLKNQKSIVEAEG